MEKSIKAEDIRALFALEPEDIRSYSPPDTGLCR